MKQMYIHAPANVIQNSHEWLVQRDNKKVHTVTDLNNTVKVEGTLSARTKLNI